MSWTSLDRVLSALSFSEPDRVPFFLPVTMHGAALIGVPLGDYYGRADDVVEGQMRLRDRLGDDFVYTFTYAAVEHEAFGGQTSFFPDGPPNAQGPAFSLSDIPALEPPDPGEVPALRRVLDITAGLYERTKGEAVVMGVVIAPFSLPVMQLGFEAYLEMLFDRPELAQRLLAVNGEFTVAWANAQLAAGATAIGFFDPVSSGTIASQDLYDAWGRAAMKQTIPRILGPTAALYASGLSLPRLTDAIDAGCGVIGVSHEEDLGEVKAAGGGKLAVLGNLNGLAMRRWTAAEARASVERAIESAGHGGGLILADSHGEIPWQVPLHVLDEISAAVHELGRYPLPAGQP